jgi:hypothetical protein
MGLLNSIVISETCTLNDETACEDNLNYFTDPSIAKLYEERYGIEIHSLSEGISPHLPPPVSTHTTYESFLYDPLEMNAPRRYCTRKQ